MKCQKEISAIFWNSVYILNCTWELHEELTIHISHVILGLGKEKDLSDAALS